MLPRGAVKDLDTGISKRAKEFGTEVGINLALEIGVRDLTFNLG